MPDIGVKITLQGEAQYRSALKQINSDQRVLEAQMKLVKAQFDGQEKSIENLSTKKALLTGALGDVQAKMDLVRDALKRSTSAYGEFDDRTMKLKEQFFNLATEEQNLNNQIDATREQIKSLSQQMADQKALDDYKKAIEGETGAMEESDRQTEELEAQLKLLDAQYDATGGSADTLKARQRNLTEQVEQQEKKVSAMRSALEKAETQFGKNSEQAREWRIKLYEAETQLTKTKEELGNTGTKLDEFGEKLAGKTGWGDAIGNLAEQFGVHLPNGIKNAINSLGEFDAASAITIGGIGAVAGAIVAAEKALWGITKDRAEQADSLNTLAEKTGLTTDEIQEYNFAAKRMDVQTSTITESLTRLTRSMDSAVYGEQKVTYAFGQLGVDFADAEGNIRDVHDVFWEVIAALGEMENRTEADGYAMDLLGRKAQDLNPLILHGRDAFEALAQEAHDTGYVMSVEDVAALVSLSDELDIFDKKLETIKNRIAIDYADSMKTLIGNLGEAAEVGGKALADSGLVDALGYIVKDIAGVLDQKDDITGMASDVNTSLRPVAETLLIIYSAFEGISDLVGGFGSGVKGAFSQLGDVINAFKTGDSKAFIEALYSSDENAKEYSGLGDVKDSFQEWLRGTAWGQWKTEMQQKDAEAAAKAEAKAAAEEAQAAAEAAVKSQGLYIRKTETGESTTAADAEAEARRARAAALRAEMNEAASKTVADEVFEEIAAIDTAFVEAQRIENILERARADGFVKPGQITIDKPANAGYNAIGSQLWRGGWTKVGENGPEDVYIPRGSRIETAQASRHSGDAVIYVNIDAKNVREFNDVVRAAENARMELRRRTG